MVKEVNTKQQNYSLFTTMINLTKRRKEERREGSKRGLARAESQVSRVAVVPHLAKGEEVETASWEREMQLTEPRG